MIKKPYQTDRNRNALFKTVKRSRHLFKASKAWGIDKDTFEDAVEHGITSVIYYDIENDIEYEASVRDIQRHSWFHDFGHGGQYFLNEKFWKQTKGEELHGEPIPQNA